MKTFARMIHRRTESLEPVLDLCELDFVKFTVGKRKRSYHMQKATKSPDENIAKSF